MDSGKILQIRPEIPSISNTSKKWKISEEGTKRQGEDAPAVIIPSEESRIT